MTILDGKKTSSDIKDEIAEAVKKLKSEGKKKIGRASCRERV